MKVFMKFSLVLASLIFVANILYAQNDLYVSGITSPTAANGKYEYAGTYNTQDYWIHEGTGFYIYNDQTSLGFWTIDNDQSSTTNYFQASSNADIDPTTVGSWLADAGTGIPVVVECISISIMTPAPINCNGDSEGELTVMVDYGTGNFNYSWSNGSSTTNTAATMNTVSGLSAGTYTVTVTAANGSVDTASRTITEPNALSITFIDSSNYFGYGISCNANNDGWIQVAGVGGSPTYSYQWDAATGSQTSATATSLSAGLYSVTITDANSCTINDTYTLTEPDALTLLSPTYSDYNGYHISCNADADGTIQVNPSGGAGVYYYLWDGNTGGQTVKTATNLSAGSFNVTVTDDNGCSADNVGAAYTLTEPNALTVSEIPTNTCAGSSTGEIDLTPSDGVTPYSYNWDNALPLLEDQVGLSTGNYSYTVTDNNGCTYNNTVTIDENEVPVPNAGVDDDACGLSYYFSGATLGMGGDASWILTSGPGIESFDDDKTSNPTVTVSVAGTYTFQLEETDISFGCAGSDEVTITFTNEPTISAGIDDDSCEGGYTISGASASNYSSLSWYTFDGMGTFSENTTLTPTYTPDANDISVGYVSLVLEAIGNGGCSNFTDTMVLALIESAVITDQPTSSTECEGNSAVFTVSATGSNLTYQWQKGGVNLVDGGMVSGTTTSSLSLMSVDIADEDSYVCVLTNECGVVNSNAANLTVEEYVSITTHPSGDAICEGQDISFTITATGTSLTYQWQKDGVDIAGATSPVLALINTTGADGGTYTCNVSNSCGMETSSGAILTVNALPTVSISGLNSFHCESDLADIFSGLPAPSGGATGVFSALIGVTDNGDGTASYDPASTGLGNFTVEYVYTDANGCTDSAKQTTSTGTALSFTNLNNSYCEYDADFQFQYNPGIAASYSLSISPTTAALIDNGDGTADFSPATAGANTYTITYEYTDGNACVNQIGEIVTVYGDANPVIMDIESRYCRNNDLPTQEIVIHALESAEGTGVITGPTGLTAYAADSAILDINAMSLTNGVPHNITYEFTHALSGCVSTKTYNVDIYNPPAVSFTMKDTFNVEESPKPFENVIPSTGGIFSGSAGIVGNSFNPQGLALGDYIVTFTYTDPATGCYNQMDRTTFIDTAHGQFIGLPANNIYCAGEKTDTIVYQPDSNSYIPVNYKLLTSSDTVLMSINSDTLIILPDTLEAGTHTIEFNYLNEDSITSFRVTRNFFIDDLGTPSIDINNYNYCVNDSSIAVLGKINGEIAGRGLFSGDGLMLDMTNDGIATFVPQAANIGSNVIVYSFNSTFPNSACKVSDTVSLVVGGITTDTIFESICQGETYVLGTHNLLATGVYTEVFANSNGCDSTIVLNLSVNPSFNDTIQSVICYGDSVFFGGDTLIATGLYIDSLVTVTGCDSIIVMNLKVDSLPLQAIKPSGTISINSLGTYNYSTTSSLYSDSTIWQIIPDTAGTITANGLSANIKWAGNFKGKTGVFVKGINRCGEGSSSDTLWVQVDHNIQAYFEYTINNYEVAFTNRSINSEVFNWNFGDGGQSQLKNPKHIYPNDGYFNVCLTVFNTQTQQSADTCIEILIGDTASVCKATFDYKVTGDTVNFVNTSPSKFTGFFWSFGDVSYSEEENPMHVYKEPDYYMVKLSAFDSIRGCLAEKVQHVYIKPDTNQSFCAANYSYVLNGNEITLINTSKGAYNDIFWKVGNKTFSNVDTVIHKFLESNYYNICLTVYNDSTKCFDQSCKDVLVLVTDTVVCKADFTYFIDSSIVSFTPQVQSNITQYQWNFGDGNFSYTKNPTHAYKKPGFYNVSLTVFDSISGCLNTNSKVISIKHSESNICNASFEWFLNDSTAVFKNTALGNFTDVFWDFGNGDYATSEDTIVTFTESGNYLVTLTIYNSETNCMDAYSELISIRFNNVDLCNASFSYFSEGNTVNFLNHSIGDSLVYFWDYDDGNYSSLKDSSHTYMEPGYYKVSLTAYNPVNGCLDEFTETIFVYDSTKVLCNADFTYIPHGMSAHFTLDATGDYKQVFWNFDDGTTSNKENPLHVFKKSGYYNVSVSVIDTLNSCFDIKEKLVYIKGNNGNQYGVVASGFKHYNAPNSLETTFKNKSKGNVSNWYWNFGDNTLASTDTSPKHVYSTNDFYRVCQTVSNKESQATKCKFIAVGDVTNSSQAYFTYFADSVTSTGHFRDKSLGNITAWHWDFGDDYTSDKKNPSHTYASIGKYVVSLTTTSASGETDTWYENVWIGNAIEDPCLISCVWPGDANNDTEANHYDVMTIGLNYNLEGPKREDATIGWYGQFAQSWSTYQLDGTNNKYGDCNGDGVINRDDIEAIQQNFAYSHYEQPDVKNADWELTCVWVDEGSKRAGSRARARAQLAPPTKKAAGNIYAIGFEIEVIGGEKMLWDSLEIDFSNSWINADGTDMLTVTSIDTNNNIINVGITRTDQVDVTGIGEIAAFSFKYKDDQEESGVSFNVTTRGGIKSSGETVTVDGNIELVLASPITICEGDTATLSAGEGFDSYLWTSELLTADIKTSTIDVSEAGDYTIEVSDSTGATASTTVTVVVNETPQVNLGDDISQSSDVELDAGSDYTSYLWSTDETSQSITVTESGTYSVEVTNENGCKGSDTIVVTITTGIESNLPNSLSVYPNPNNGKFWLDYMFTSSKAKTVKVINIEGRVIWLKDLKEDKLEKRMLNIKDLDQGVYYLKVVDGERSGIVRFMKQ